LRGLLTNQQHLILLNLWRLVGVVFLALMAGGQMPARNWHSASAYFWVSWCGDSSAPGTSPGLPDGFARPAAYGDLTTSLWRCSRWRP